MKQEYLFAMKHLRLVTVVSLAFNVLLLCWVLSFESGDAACCPCVQQPDVSTTLQRKGVPELKMREDGWVGILERVPSRTRRTLYDPNNDHELFSHPHRYARSPVPKGSWRVQVAPGRILTMDEVAFAYDLWFEENRVFSTISWFGVHMQQDPTDAIVIQDMLWRVKPDLIIEIGTNTGGGAIFYATIMKAYNPQGKIVTLDVKPVGNWMSLKNSARCVGCILGTQHPWWNDGMIKFIQGRVTNPDIQSLMEVYVQNATTVLVIEDASHRYPDTLHNLNAVHRFVTPGSYLLVQDTKMDRFVAGGAKYGNYHFGPMRSVDEFIATNKEFVIDRRFEYFLYSQHHRGFLRKLREGEIS